MSWASASVKHLGVFASTGSNKNSPMTSSETRSSLNDKLVKDVPIPSEIIEGPEHNQPMCISDCFLFFWLRFTGVFACGLECLQEMLLQ